MLVRFSGRAWRTTGGLSLWLLAAACSLVVGELPEPLPERGGPLAGAGADAGGGAETGGTMGVPRGGAESTAGVDSLGGAESYGGTPSSGQAGEPMAHAGDGTGNAAGTGNSVDPCDVDGDEHLAKGKCGGDDCDDTDDRVWPGQPDYFAERQANVGFDYDCSGEPELEETKAVACAGLVSCPSGTGFLESLPACGEVGDYGTCKSAGLGCEGQVIDNQHVMRCR
jgi:hypothetical protein